MFKLILMLIKSIPVRSHLRPVFVLLLITIATLSGIFIPVVLKNIVEALQNQKSEIYIINLFYLLAGIVIFGRVCQEAKFHVYANWESQLLRSTLNYFYSEVLNNKATFFNENKTGSITSRVFLSVFGLKSFLFDTIFQLLPLLLEIILIIPVVMFVLSYSVGITLLIGIFSYLALIILLNNRLLIYQSAVREATVESQGSLTDHLSCWKDLKLISGKNNSQRKFQDYINRFTQSTVVFYQKRTVFGIMQSLLLAITFLIANYITIQGGLNNATTVGGIVLINGYLLQLLQPLESFGLLYRNISHAYSEFCAINTCLDTDLEYFTKANASEEDNLWATHNQDTTLEIKNFHKPGILSDINISIQQPCRIAIVGKTGSGKTSILDAISGLDSAYKGDIVINGVNTKELKPSDLNKKVIYLPSDSRLLTMTIKENLLLSEFSDQQCLDQVIQLTELESKIEQLGLDANVSEQMRNLSQGEKQRIKLARILLSPGSILLLDEPTSAIDASTESLIIDRLLELNQGILIFVTHNLTNLNKFDKVLLIEEGKLIEQGHHLELINQEGKYFQLWKANQAI